MARVISGEIHVLIKDQMIFTFRLKSSLKTLFQRKIKTKKIRFKKIASNFKKVK